MSTAKATPGIDARHRRTCPGPRPDGKCCAASYQAHVFDKRTGKRILEELPNAALKGGGTRLTIAAFLLLGSDPTGQPQFRTRGYEGFRRLLDLPAEQIPEIDPEGVYRPDDLAARLVQRS